MTNLDGNLTSPRRDGANRDDKATCVAVVRAAATIAAFLLGIALCTGCSTTDPSGNLRPASAWHLYDQAYGRWW